MRAASSAAGTRGRAGPYPDVVYNGAWRDGQRHGEGQATYADGTTP